MSETVRTGYHEVFCGHLPQADRLVEPPFAALVDSQQSGLDAEKLSSATDKLIARAFHRGDNGFWFNSLHDQYKTVTKPEAN